METCDILEQKKAAQKARRLNDFKVRYKKKYKDPVLDHYGKVCNCCGEATREFLCIDHINNDGAEHRRKIGKKMSIYIWLYKNEYPEGFQILCYNCNNAKQYYGSCPHQIKIV